MRVITYGTFDLFHEGHIRLLERAKALGDHLIVAVTTENFDEARGKLNVQQSLMERVKNVQDSGLADEVILEEYEGQKVNDMQKYDVDIFAIGSDWLGKFDYLNDYCKVVYLERTKGISSTQLRNEDSGILRIGVVGTGRIAHRFVDEAHFVSGVDVEGAWSRDVANVKSFVDQHELDLAAGSFAELLDHADAVYIATPHGTHVDYALQAIEAGKHVLCEKPMALEPRDVDRIAEAAAGARRHVAECLMYPHEPQTAAVLDLVAKGAVGEVRAMAGCFTFPLTRPADVRLDPALGGGSLWDVGCYPVSVACLLAGAAPVEASGLAVRHKITTTFVPESQPGVDAVATPWNPATLDVFNPARLLMSPVLEPVDQV